MHIPFRTRTCLFALIAWIPTHVFSEAIPLAEIGAKATADYAGDGLSVSAKPSGAYIDSVFQKLKGEATPDGLWITSTEEGGGRFRVKATTLGRATHTGPPNVFHAQGKVEVVGNFVRYTRPGVTEEYSSSVDGIRQDFLIDQRPAGSGELGLELDVMGATAEPLADGVRLTLEGSGRELSYHRLYVTDANGKELPARMEVTEGYPSRLILRVDDTDAIYPIRIDPTFSDANWFSMGGLPGTNNNVLSATVDDSGNLYIGGVFTIAGDVKANRIARWNGSTWSPLGDGFNGNVRTLAFSNGKLYAGGDFSTLGGSPGNHIAQWDGSSWAPLGSGMNNSVRALVFAGDNLYAGGFFTTAGGSPAAGIAKWNGSSWSALGSGMNSTVFALAVMGADLYAGGVFTTAGGTTANSIAKWDGNSWSALGAGVSGTNTTVFTLAVIGGNLYAGGGFTFAGGSPANRVAMWNGSSWSPLGSGCGSFVRALAVMGGELYAGGDFTTAGGFPANRIARWNGDSWAPLGTGVNSNSVEALAVSGGVVYAGGSNFTLAGGNPANRIAGWNGSSWSPLGSGINNGVNAVALSGNDLYVAGSFTSAGTVAANRIARWDGTSWSPLGTGTNGSVFALAASSEGNLYAGGIFTSAGGVPGTGGVARWNGSSWSSLGSGTNNFVNALAVSGSDLYAGGIFSSAGGVSASRIARWNGASWLPLGSGMDGTVHALAVSGDNLYAGGAFSTAGGAAANRIARWDGVAWEPLGDGLDGTVFALAASESDLYAGGGFSLAGGIAANRIARWNGASWFPLGEGMNLTVNALAVSGGYLYAGGGFTTAGGNPASRIARWDATSWLPMGSGANASVNALAVSENDLFVGGDFLTVGDKVSAQIARAQIGEPNAPPTALAQNLSTDRNISRGITLSGTDPEDEPLTYTVASNPSHGSLTGIAPNLTYTPTNEYVGEDSFTFFVNDGTSASAPATVTIQVNEPTPPQLPDLAVEVSAPTTAAPGVQFEYLITARNLGNEAASGVTVSFTRPAGLTFNGTVAPVSSGFSAQGNPPGIFTGGNIAAGGSVVLRVRVTPGTYSTVIGSAIIDPSNTIAESDETNNASTQIINTVVTSPFDYTYTIGNGEVTITGYTGAGGAITIPATIEGLPVRVIGTSAFQDKTAITSVTLPNSVTTIQGNAFGFCTGLKTVSLPNGLTTIGSGAFQSCSSLTAIIIPNTVSIIGSSAFESCPALITAILPAGLTTIADRLFHSCVGLSEIAIPATVTSIGISSFQSCMSLTDIILPGGLTTIQNGAFAGCSGITTITFPATVTSIGSGAFSFCFALNSAFYLGDAPSMGPNVFADAAASFTVFFDTSKSGFTTPTWLGYPSMGIDPDSPPSITSQPSSQTIASGATATLSVGVSGNPVPNFQWYQGNSGDTSNPIPGATSASFTTPALTATTSYWVRASNTSGAPANSDTATVTVTLAVPDWQVAVAGPFSVARGDEFEYVVTVTNVGTAPLPPTDLIIVSDGESFGPAAEEFEWLSYQFAGGDNIVFGTPEQGITSGIFETVALAPGESDILRLRMRVPATATATAELEALVNFSSALADSNPANNISSIQTAVTQGPSITTHPVSQTVNSGSTATLSVAATGNPTPTFQWYLGNSGETSNPIAGATNPSFTTPALTQAQSYWVRASNTEGTADSQTATITLTGGNNANLSGLSLGMPPLSPGFNQLTTSYTSAVPNFVTSIRVTPTAVASGAGIKVNGVTVLSGTESSPINLNPGGNLIDVVVTAPDLITTKTYAINLIRTEPPVVTTEPAKGVGSSGAVLHGTVDPNGGATVYFEYGTTTSYGNSTPPQFVTGNATIPFQSTISGLPGGTLVHFRAVVSQLGVFTNGMNRSFTTLPPPVIVVTGNPVVTADTAATLVGAVNTQGQQAEVFFEYGTTAAYGNSTPPRLIPASSGLQDVLEAITGLIPNTFYHVRLVATSPSPVGGNDVVFQAKVVSGSGTGSPTAVPSVTTGAVVDVQDDSGTLKGTVNANGGTTTAYFQYGTTPSSLGQETDVQPIGNGNEDAEVSIPASNLLPGTRYYYRLMAENSLGLSVPGAEAFFDTNFSPPVVTTGSVEALTTTSVRVSGSVQAGNSDTTVEIIYGTNPSSLSDGIATTPALVTGDEETSVSADLEDLLQSVTYYYQVRAVNSGGTTLGEMMTFRVSTLSGLLQVFPDALDPADHEGSLQVNITPGEIGAGWRFAGEQAWRLPGETVSGLTSGDRVIEYRAISGYLAPSSETVTVVSGDPSLVLARTYEASGETGSGSLTVSIKPETIAAASRPVAERAQWRLLGETDSDWKDSGEISAALPPGNHVVECKPIAGRNTPPPASVVVSDGATASAILTYYEADPTMGDLPEVVDFRTVRDEESLPYAYVGQIRSDAGSSTGFVVRPRVVATVAHAVFDDGTLASATGLQWLFQRHRGVHEPAPMIPRGFYTLTGYAAQRAADNSPGISTPESQHLDAAAMYFSGDAGRSGFSGYLASDLDENEFLISTALKTLVGYPIENIAADNLDRMHASTPEDITFTLPTGTTRTFTTDEIRSTGGGSGGPLCVLASNGKFYPTGIYLGGTGQTIVRAIDSDVATLFGFAEISGNSADGSGRGSITASETSPVGTPSLGSLRVLIEPAGARTAGAGWRITSGAFLASGAQLDSLSPNSYGINFSTVPGYEVPATPSVEITGGFLKTVTFTYEIIIPSPVINSAAGVLVNKGGTLEYQTTATNSPTTFSLSGLLPLGTVFDPATGRITGIAQEAGRFPVVVGVSNLGGSDTQSVEIVSLPVMIPQSVNAPYLESLEYQIVSSEEGEGVVFSASNLPPGLSLDTSTGVISGTPTTPGTYLSPISVSLNGATKASVLTFEITGTPPEITEHPAASTVIEYGGNVVLTVATSGLPTPSVQWYRGNSGDVSQPVPGATSATFVSPTLTIATSFWARVSNLSGSADSTTAAVTPLPSTNANLAFLSLNAAPLSPSFNPAVTSYTASVPNSLGGIRLTPNPAVPVSTLTINGVPSPVNSPSEPVMLAVGANTITILVTAQDGTTTKTYTATVTRAPAPIVITEGADGINDITATLRGTVNPRGNGTVFFDFGPTTTYGRRSAPQQVSGNSPQAISAPIGGLAGNQTYHYRVGFSDGGPPVFGQDMTFTTSPSRPLVVTGSAANVSETQATLIGIVNPRGSQTNVRFEYGTDPNSLVSLTPFQNIGSGTRVVEVTAAITGLSAGVTYYYRTVAESVAFAEPVVGEIQQFIAVTAPTTGDGLADSPPTVIGGSETATSITEDSAVFQATINPNDGSTLVYFEYGMTTSYGFQSDSFRIGNGTENSLVTIPVENFETGVTYFFRAVAENAMGVVMGTGSSFTTTFPTPTVTTGEAVAISSRSARVNGTVNANGTTRDVYFQYGTDGVTFPLSVRAFQLTVDGSLDTPVYVDLVNLDEGVTYFYKVVATDVGEAEGTEGATLSFNATVLLGLIRQAPEDVEISGRSGQVTVNLLPAGTGSWRFSGEQAWRASGETAAGLTEGDRTIEFRPVAGSIQPPAELVTLDEGDPPLVLERDYYESASVASGSLQANLFPTSISDPGVTEQSRAQWRLANDADTAWKDSGQVITGLPAGSYLVESKPLSGWDIPVLTSINVTDDDDASISITYSEAATPSANPPAAVSFEAGQDDTDLPYVHGGQVRSASGSNSGFVVKPKVVATVAQAVFDEATLATVTGLQWLQQRDSASHEPKPMEPRGSYIFLGYESQRLSENSPGELSLDSHDLNVAALYFFIDAGRGGFSGFLASDETDNEFLTSADPKILSGYPIGGTAQGRMHATAPDTVAFTWEQGKTFSSTAIRGLGGMAGGPLSVRYEGGAYYPAGIYVGGTDTGYVRAIDSDIIDIFTRAEVSANGGDNNTNGGITQTSIIGNLSVTEPGSLRVLIEPAEAVASGAAWQLMPESTLRQGGAQKSGLAPGTYNLALSTVDGYDEPDIQTVAVSGGQLTTVTFTYAETVGTTPLDLWRFENFGTYLNTGDAADDFDFDNDGETNIDEFTAGTSPKDSDDFLKMATTAKSGNIFTTTCAGKAGRTYTLLRNTELSGEWTRLESQGPLAEDAAVTLTDTTAPPANAFYLIEVIAD